MKIPKPRHGRMHLVTQIAAAGSAAAAVGGMFFGNHAEGVAYLALTLGWLATGRVLILERQAKPKVINFAPSTPEQVEEFKRHLKEDLQRQATRWV